MRNATVAIVDSGGANIASLTNALARLGVAGTLTRDARTIRNASRVILPGVGAAASAMSKLASDDLVDVIAKLEQPVLGICLGMQLLARSSAEDGAHCIGIVPVDVQKLEASPQTPVPNMGWCRVRQTGAHDLFAGIDDGSYFYFVHSYALAPGDYTIAIASHAHEFTAVLAYRNFYAAQFHPERSAGPGAIFLRNFLEARS